MENRMNATVFRQLETISRITDTGEHCVGTIVLKQEFVMSPGSHR
jgi:hypothetical protein